MPTWKIWYAKKMMKTKQMRPIIRPKNTAAASSAFRLPPQVIETTVRREPQSDARPIKENVRKVMATAKSKIRWLFFQINKGVNEKKEAVIRKTAIVGAVMRFKLPPLLTSNAVNG
jgi:hypothetical protein